MTHRMTRGGKAASTTASAVISWTTSLSGMTDMASAQLMGSRRGPIWTRSRLTRRPGKNRTPPTILWKRISLRSMTAAPLRHREVRPGQVPLTIRRLQSVWWRSRASLRRRRRSSSVAPIDSRNRNPRVGTAHRRWARPATSATSRPAMHTKVTSTTTRLGESSRGPPALEPWIEGTAAMLDPSQSRRDRSGTHAGEVRGLRCWSQGDPGTACCGRPQNVLVWCRRDPSGPYARLTLGFGCRWSRKRAITTTSSTV